MPYEEKVAERIRQALPENTIYEEKKMFGGLALLIGGKMAIGVQADRLVLKLGNDRTSKALQRKHTHPMDFTGKVIRSMLFVEPSGFRTKAQLQSWLKQALDANEES